MAMGIGLTLAVVGVVLMRLIPALVFASKTADACPVLCVHPGRVVLVNATG